MSKKNIINLVAAITVSTLAFGSVANAAELTQNQEAKLTVMKSEHIQTLNDYASDLLNFENQKYFLSLYSANLDGVADNQQQIDRTTAKIAKEIAHFHNDVALEFGYDVAQNIYTNEQIAQFEEAKEKYKKANS